MHHVRRRWWLLPALLLVLSLSLTTSKVAHAQNTFVVTNCSTDSQLQQDVSQANSDNANDLIEINCGGSADIKLTKTLTITSSMTINGSGSAITLDGQQTQRIFLVKLASPATLTLNSLILAKGLGFWDSNNAGAGGAIANRGSGTVNIINSTLTNNSAGSVNGGAIDNENGTMNITNSTLTNNFASSSGGGAIITYYGVVNITNSTLTNNSAFLSGGAIYNAQGTVTVTNSTLANNSATGIAKTRDVGGAIVNAGTATIINSTLTNNSAYNGNGGAIANEVSMSITSSTLTNNFASLGGGAIRNTYGSLSITGSILAGNTAYTDSGLNNCYDSGSPPIHDNGYNLESGTDCGFTGTGSKQNTNPLLDPNGLQMNGGPTQTIALTQGSPAIDQIPAAQCPSTDQRGDPRPEPDTTAEATCDMGAYESNSSRSVYVHTSTSANTLGDFTLLDNPVTNNNPNAVVFITANYNPGGPYNGFDNRNTGVWYDASAGKWGIFNEDGSRMPIGVSFNVYALPGSSPYGGIFVQSVTSANSLDGYITVIDNPTLNDNPGAKIMVTQNWNPAGSSGVYNNHAFGVWYDSSPGKWTIYNEDRTNLPIGASFNVINMTGVTDTFTQVATTSNTSGDSTYTNDSQLNDNPNGLAFITHSYGTGGPYMTDPTAVWYNASLGEWGVFDSTYANMPTGNSFFVTGIAAHS